MNVGTAMKFCICITTNFLLINGTKRYRHLKYLINCIETLNNGAQDVGKMKTHTKCAWIMVKIQKCMNHTTTDKLPSLTHFKWLGYI